GTADPDCLGAGARHGPPGRSRAFSAPAGARARTGMIVEEDIAAQADTLAPAWAKLDGARIFMTGGTGFIGRWMLEALLRAPIEAPVTVLSRNPRRFAEPAPQLADRVPAVYGDG